MTTLLHKFVLSYPDVTLSHTEYGRHFHLGHGARLFSSPTQHIQSFVEIEGLPYRFIVVGRLMSFKVVDDPFGHHLCINIGQIESPSAFADMFRRQLVTLQRVEESDRANVYIHGQHIQWRTSNDQLALTTYAQYDIHNSPLSSSDIGSFVLATVELRCLDVICSASTFLRSYWMEAFELGSLKANNCSDEEFVKNIIEHWQLLNPSIVSNT
ncbi:hypothetical protein BYT27DRAFT_7264773 [Phlegmacium glaucopus]|nr:hypothetical protein BYT27DRAFT_7264773 [Phlegmacium glaucopus]